MNVTNSGYSILGGTTSSTGASISIFGRDATTVQGDIVLRYGGYDTVGYIYFAHRLSDGSQVTKFTFDRVGGLTLSSITIGANTLDTTEWANLDGLNQKLDTSQSPTFLGLNLSGAITTPTSITLAASGWVGLGSTNQRIEFASTTNIYGSVNSYSTADSLYLYSNRADLNRWLKLTGNLFDASGSMVVRFLDFYPYDNNTCSIGTSSNYFFALHVTSAYVTSATFNGAISGVTDLSMTGAISTPTSLAMNGAISGVTSLTMSSGLNMANNTYIYWYGAGSYRSMIGLNASNNLVIGSVYDFGVVIQAGTNTNVDIYNPDTSETIARFYTGASPSIGFFKALNLNTNPISGVSSLTASDTITSTKSGYGFIVDSAGSAWMKLDRATAAGGSLTIDFTSAGSQIAGIDIPTNTTDLRFYGGGQVTRGIAISDDGTNPVIKPVGTAKISFGTNALTDITTLSANTVWMNDTHVEVSGSTTINPGATNTVVNYNGVGVFVFTRITAPVNACTLTISIDGSSWKTPGQTTEMDSNSYNVFVNEIIALKRINSNLTVSIKNNDVVARTASYRVNYYT